MKEMTIEEIKKVQLDILIYIDKICKENNIEYSLAYGTLLGAVRHKGFIPWDDDIDIILKRLEYNKLINTLYEKNNDRYRVFSMKDEGYFYPYAKVSDNKTFIKEKNWPDYKGLGVYVDIFPIDYVPNDNGEGYYLETFRYVNGLYNCLTDIAYVHDKTYKRLLKRLFRFRGVNRDRKKGEQYWKQKIADMTQLSNSSIMASIVSGKYCPWNKDILDNLIELEFENNKFNAVEDYDTMLRSYYGSYMELPPENERVSNHDFKAYWKD